jgi:nitroreductase
VPDELIMKILEAAMSAPSAANEQPWHFIVIRDRKILEDIPRFHPYSGMLRQAQIAILVCGDMRLDKADGYWVQDCSAASENILIAAHASGLGAVWTGIFPREERVTNMRTLLGIPDDVIPLSLIPIGYPDEMKPPARRFDESRIHTDRW